MNQPARPIKREELYEVVWSKPIKALAEEWNTTYARLVQACDTMEVPRPTQGHWQLVARGASIQREPLPEPTGDIPTEWPLLPLGVREAKTANQRNALPTPQEQKKRDGTIETGGNEVGEG